MNIVRMAKGIEPPHVLIRGGTFLDLFAEEVLADTDVAIWGDRIGYVGPEYPGPLSADTLVIEGEGLYLVPGFIDPHCHLDFVFQVREYARYALPRGTTTVVTEAAMVANAAGPDGVRIFVEEAKGAPFRVFFLCPSVIPPFPQFEESAGFPYEAFQEFISRPDCLGLGETYWPRVVLDEDPEILGRMSYAMALGRRLEGHTAGAKGEKLQAYLSAGVTSCHEATDAEEALNLARLGVAVMIRQGYIRQEVPRVAPVRGRLKDKRNLMLCTDLLDPEALMDHGAMDWAVREAIAYGFSPIEALRMATINPASYFGLRDLGLLAPGRKADLLLLEDLERVKVRMVLLDGKVVAEGGKPLGEVPPFPYPQGALRSFKLKGVGPEDFSVPHEGEVARVRVIRILNSTITDEDWEDLPVREGNIRPAPEADVVKAAQISRHHEAPRLSLGFVKGLGLRQGALATSLTWDTNNIFVVGADEEDMAYAVNQLLKTGGGFFAVKGGRVLASVGLPVWGILSPKPMEELGEEIRAFDAAAEAMGVRGRAFVLLQTLPFSGLPYLRLTDRGLLDVKERTFVPLVEAP